MAITDATNPQASTPTQPVANDAPVTPNTPPVVNDLDLSLDLPSVVKEKDTSDTDRLKEEDKLVETEAPTTEVIKLETPAEEKQETLVQENLPQDAKEFTLQDDMKIIQELKNPESTKIESQAIILETKPAEEVKPIEPIVESKPIESTTTPAPANNTMNLDSLLFATATPATTAPVETVKNPFDLIQANTPTQQVAQPAVMMTTATTTQAMPAKKKNGVKIGLFIVMFVALGFLTYFIISTMYPMGLFNNSSTGQNNIVAVATGASLTGNSLTGDTLTGTAIGADTTGSASGDIAMTSGTTALDSGHGSAMDPNFSDINNLMNDASGNTTTPALGQDTVVAKLNNYGDLGAKYLVPSKAQNDLQSMKYALFLKNKSQTLLNEIIANPTAITTMQSDLTTQLAQMETFLQSLQTKYGDLSTATAQTQTGTPDQIPNSLTQE